MSNKGDDDDSTTKGYLFSEENSMKKYKHPMRILVRFKRILISQR